MLQGQDSSFFHGWWGGEERFQGESPERHQGVEPKLQRVAILNASGLEPLSHSGLVSGQTDTCVVMLCCDASHKKYNVCYDYGGYIL